MESTLQRLEALQKQLSETLDLFDKVGKVSILAAEGTDRSGSVTVRLTAEGFLEHVRLHGGWRQRTPASSLGAAVVEAAQQAMVERMTQWSRGLVQSGIVSSRQQPPTVRVGGNGSDAVPTPWLSGRQLLSLPTREPSEIVEDVLATVEGMEQGLASAPFGPATHVGTAANGRVKVVLSTHAVQSCELDSGWVAGVSDSRIESALRTAAESARSTMAMAPENALTQFSRRSDELVGELMAILTVPTVGGSTPQEGTR
jgi:hypothetical protein